MTKPQTQYHTMASAARYLHYHRNTIFHAVHIAGTLVPDAWAGDDEHAAPLFLKETLDEYNRAPLRGGRPRKGILG